MKKLIINASALLLFAGSVSFFIASCHKEATANPTGTGTTTGITQQGKILYEEAYATGRPRVFIANYDGSSAQQVNINFPATGFIAGLTISPDGKTIFFVQSIDSAGVMSGNIYKCNSDGSGVTQITPTANGFNYSLPVAY